MSGRRWNNWSKKHRHKRREPDYAELVQLLPVLKKIGEAAKRMGVAFDELSAGLTSFGKEMQETYKRHGDEIVTAMRSSTEAKQLNPDWHDERH